MVAGLFANSFILDAGKVQHSGAISVGSQFVQDGVHHLPLDSMKRFQQLVASGMALLVLFSVVSLSGQRAMGTKLQGAR